MTHSRTEIVSKTLFYLFLLLFFCGLETAVFTRIFPTRATPELLPFLIAAAAVYDGAVPGIAAGGVVGFFMDGMVETFPFYTILYMIIGGTTGSLSPAYFKKRFMPVVFWGGLGCLAGEFLRFFLWVYLFGQSAFFTGLGVIISKIIFSVLMSPILICPFILFQRPFKREQRIFR